MKKFLLVLTALTFLLVSCPDGPSPGKKYAEPVKPAQKTLVVFDNTYGVCTAVVYDDYRRRSEDKIAEVPAGQRSNEIEFQPSDSVPFYFAYLLNLNGVNDYTVNYVPKNGKDQKAVRIDAKTKNTVFIPKLDETFSSGDQLLSSRSSLLLRNASTFSFELHRGRSSVPPDGKTSSSVVNSFESAFYTINTSDVFDPSAKVVSNYHLLVGADYKEFPDDPDRFEPGHFYSYTYYNNVDFVSDIPIKFDNVTVKTYTITFSVNGGNGTAPVAQTAKAGSVIRLPEGNGLTKSGHTFGGWNLAASGEEINYSAGSDYLATGDITLYAKWYPLGTVTYTVTFDSNGGNVIATQYTASGLTAFRPTNPIKTGYDFVDWYVDFDLTKEYNFSSPITGNITLYAKWETVRHTVTFNPNGADGTVTALQTENDSSEITLPDGTDLIKDGYVFGGWSTDDSGAGEIYNPGDSYTVTGDVTLFPKWDSQSYTVAFNLNYPGAPIPQTQKVYGDEKAVKPSPDPVRTGHTFGGWYNELELTNPYDFDTAVTEDITLYAKWDIVKYSVAFNLNYPEAPSPQTQTVNSGAKAVRPSPNPTRTGYTFGGWYRELALTNLYDFDAAVTGDISLYAKWDIVKYTVTFNLNYTGAPSPQTQAVNSGAKAVRPSPDPTRTDYTFGGWYGELALTNLYDFDDAVTRDISLYAKWWVEVDGMVWIPAGTFKMGSPTSEPGRYSDETQHSVTLSGFYMGKYQVTQEQYQAVMESNPSYFTSAVSGESGTPGKLPVECVSWYDALVFCNKLSMTEGLNPAYSINGKTNPADWGTVPTSSDATWNAVVIVAGSNGYRLPTEAQWEYACRAGTTTVYNTGDTINDNTGWYNSNSGGKTHQVGKKPANAWGLHDMHGNVWEWCWDWYNNYSSGAQTDPMGASSGTDRVARGGGWGDSAGDLRSARRIYYDPYDRYRNLGFRLVRP